MDCVNARLLLTLAGRNRGDIDAADGQALQGHLHACADCAQLARAQSAFDATVGRAMLDVPVPTGLPARLLAGLPRQRRRRPVAWLAAAAALLLGVAMGGHWWTNRPIDFIPDGLVPVSFTNNSAEPAEDWFRDMGLAFAYPHQFQPEYLQSYDIARLQGRRVPRLIFVASAEGNPRPVVAHVFVLSGDNFRTPAEIRQAFSTHTLEVMAGPQGSGFSFAVVYPAGASLQPLLVRPAI